MDRDTAFVRFFGGALLTSTFNRVAVEVAVVDRKVPTTHEKTHALLQIQDNVATPVTAMMVTVCISTDAL